MKCELERQTAIPCWLAWVFVAFTALVFVFGERQSSLTSEQRWHERN